MMSRRRPRVTIRCHPLDLVNEPERIRATRRGEILHLALGLIGATRGPTERRSGGMVPGKAPGSAPATGSEPAAPQAELERRAEAAVIRAFAALDLDPGAWNLQEDFVRPLVRVLEIPRVRSWLDPAAAALEEAEILDVDGSVYRPDRIVFREGGIEVVDFKAGRREQSHQEQVGNYVGLLRAIFGNRTVTGHLVYIDEPAVVEVG